MSTPTTVQGNLVPISLSTDNSTYKSIVCNRAWDLDLNSSVTQEETDCGSFPALGAVTWAFNMEGVLNTTPNGATEMSAKAVMDIANNQTVCYIKVQYPNPGGTDFYMRGQGYITNFKITKQTGSLIAFSATFTGSGIMDTTP